MEDDQDQPAAAAEPTSHTAAIAALCARHPEIQVHGFWRQLEQWARFLESGYGYPEDVPLAEAGDLVATVMRSARFIPDAYRLRFSDETLEIWEVIDTHAIPAAKRWKIGSLAMALDSDSINTEVHLLHVDGAETVVDGMEYYREALRNGQRGLAVR